MFIGISPNKPEIASVAFDGTMRIWGTHDQPVAEFGGRRLRHHTGLNFPFAESPDDGY